VSAKIEHERHALLNFHALVNPGLKILNIWSDLFTLLDFRKLKLNTFNNNKLISVWFYDIKKIYKLTCGMDNAIVVISHGWKLG